MSRVTELLKRAKERISDYKRWTRGVYARDRYGRCTPSASTAACQWCAVGSLLSFARDYEPREINAANFLLDGFNDGLAATTINDTQEHQAVLDMYDRAIKKSEEMKDASV